MVRRVWKVIAEVPPEEAELLDDCHEIIAVTGKFIADSALFENLGKNERVVFYIVQASWGFLRSILSEWFDRGYHSAYVLGRALTEYYIEACFIPKEDTAGRGAEFEEAWKTPGRDPYKRVAKFEKYASLKARAKSVGLERLYAGSYKSLCNFSHLDLRGSLIARQSPKFSKDKAFFLIAMMQLYLELLDIISKRLAVIYPAPMQTLIRDKLAKFEQMIPKEKQVYPSL